MQYARRLATGREAQTDQLVLADRIGIRNAEQGGRNKRRKTHAISLRRHPLSGTPRTAPDGPNRPQHRPTGRNATLEFRLAQPQKQQRQGDEQRYAAAESAAPPGRKRPRATVTNPGRRPSSNPLRVIHYKRNFISEFLQINATACQIGRSHSLKIRRSNEKATVLFPAFCIRIQQPRTTEIKVIKEFDSDKSQNFLYSAFSVIRIQL